MEHNKLEEAIKHGKEMLDVFGGEHEEFIEVAIECIDKALSQPEIIHCSECKYFTNLNDDEFALCDRAFTGMYVDADGSGFCKWAERRTDG